MSLTKPMVMPVKGDIISMSIEGTPKYYRVLKTGTEDSTLGSTRVEVYAMTNYRGNCQYANVNPPASTTFGGIKGIKYEGSNIDYYYNTIFYNRIKDNATGIGSYKVSDAIVDRTIKQRMFKWSQNAVSGKTNYRQSYIYHTNSYSEDVWETMVNYVQEGYGEAASGPITRKVYIPDAKDILDYVGATTGTDSGLTGENLSMLLYNVPTGSAFNYDFPFLRSAYDIVTTSLQAFTAMFISTQGLAQVHAFSKTARPMFTIDLSKVAFNIYEEPTNITDLTHYVWSANRVLTPFAVDRMFDVKVNYNENTYNTFGQSTTHIGTVDQVHMTMDNFSRSYCFDDGEGKHYWYATSSMTVEFVGGSDATNTDLINWLKANGTLKRNLYLPTVFSIYAKGSLGWVTVTRGSDRVHHTGNEYYEENLENMAWLGSTDSVVLNDEITIEVSLIDPNYEIDTITVNNQPFTNGGTWIVDGDVYILYTIVEKE